MVSVKHLIASAVVGTAIVAGSVVAQAAPTIGTFQSGDRWCAIGDSITHGGSYHQFIYLYYATRFPGRSIGMFNCGISGDTAAGTLRRLKWDILDHKPTVASIMLGMNDVGIFAYGPTKNTPQDEEQRKSSITTYAANMRKLVTELRSAGVRVTLITPSIYDQTAAFGGPIYPGGNDGLGICSEHVVGLAKEFDTALADFYRPMTRINAKQQESDPQYTLIGGDRVHPGDTGHMVMAYLFLKAQGAPQYVSYMGVDAGGQVARQTNCAITDVKSRKGQVSFTCLENSLPFPVSQSSQPALKLVPFTSDLNQETLQVGGLESGRYAVSIDGKQTGQYDAADLGSGVNLATVTSTPQYAQATKVMEINQKRHTMEAQDLRWIALMEYVYLQGKANGHVSLADAKPVFEKLAAEQKGVVADWVKNYLKNKPREAEIRRQIDAYAVEMRKTAQPKPHRFVVRRVSE